MAELQFKLPINAARLAAEIAALPGAIETLPDGTKRSLVSVVHNDVDGTVTIHADDSLDQATLDAITTTVETHNPTPSPVPPAVDFGTDVPDDYQFQLAQAVALLRQYLASSSPSAAATTAAVKLTIRVVLYLVRRQLGQ